MTTPSWWFLSLMNTRGNRHAKRHKCQQALSSKTIMLGIESPINSLAFTSWSSVEVFVGACFWSSVKKKELRNGPDALVYRFALHWCFARRLLWSFATDTSGLSGSLNTSHTTPRCKTSTTITLIWWTDSYGRKQQSAGTLLYLRSCFESVFSSALFQLHPWASLFSYTSTSGIKKKSRQIKWARKRNRSRRVRRNSTTTTINSISLFYRAEGATGFSLTTSKTDYQINSVTLSSCQSFKITTNRRTFDKILTILATLIIIWRMAAIWLSNSGKSL